MNVFSSVTVVILVITYYDANTLKVKVSQNKLIVRPTLFKVWKYDD